MDIARELNDNFLAKTIIDSFPEMIFIFDRDRRIKAVNEAVKSFLEYDFDNMFLESKYGELLNCSYLQDQEGCGVGPFCSDCMIRDIIEDVFVYDRPVINREGLLNIVMDGKEEKFHVIINSFSFNYGLEKYVFMTIRNIDEIKEYEKRKIENLEKLSLIGASAASIVHDIKNPLTGIIGYVYLLEKKLKKEDNEKIFEKLEQSINNLEYMIEEILNIASGKEEMNIHPVSLNYSDFILKNAKEINVDNRLIFDIQEGVYLKIDAGKIHQVIWNLIKNADEAIEEEGEIKVSVYIDSGMVVTKVSDTGKGIPDERKAKLFSPGATFEKENGKGFGLFSVKKIIEAHNGNIRFESKTGKGTTFYFVLPM